MYYIIYYLSYLIIIFRPMEKKNLDNLDVQICRLVFSRLVN